MAAEHDTEGRTTDGAPAAAQTPAQTPARTPDRTPVRAPAQAHAHAEPRKPSRPAAEPPPQAVMGLLNYLTATSLDEDYAHVSQKRATAGAPRRKSPGTVGLVVLAVFGVLVATAAVQTSRNADESASSRESLVNQVNSRKAELTAKRAQATSLTREVAALQDSNLDATNQGRALRSRLDRLGVIGGSVPAKGPGIRVVVDDAPGATEDKQQVLDQDLQKLVNALWLVGAEAVSINGQRVTNLTAIREGGSAITVNFVSMNRPYTVSAIGNKNQMAAKLLDTEGGRTWLTLRASFGLKFDVTSEDSMTLPAARPFSLRYARQPERLR
jgi:uncharacterized protein YlxW (UPF0749 family)